MATTAINSFAEDVFIGLSLQRKQIPSKYFYDDIGSMLFSKIMELPEYYPTRCELEILRMQSAEIFKKLQFTSEYKIVELGCGDGQKTIELLRTFMKQGLSYSYVPIDISEAAIIDLTTRVNSALPDLTIKPVVMDYLENNIDASPQPVLFLFLGGNIGNFSSRDSASLLRHFAAAMKKGDKLLIGMDLKKNPHVISAAYDDEHGITREFNLNLLRRMNRELGTDFNLKNFDFFSHYSPVTGEVNSFLVSLKNQNAFCKALSCTFRFLKDEVIWTELSKKYAFSEITALAAECGFSVDENFCDDKAYFCDSLWTKL